MNKIISFVMVGTNDLEKSSKFYDAIFVHLGLKKVTTSENMISYSHSNDPHEVKFYITKPEPRSLKVFSLKLSFYIVVFPSTITNVVLGSVFFLR